MSVSKAVLIIGCSSGIGWATAERLVDVGWRVYATARNVEKMAPLERRGCGLLPLDVSDEDSMRSAVDEIERRKGTFGVLVNNAGYSQSGGSSRRTSSGWRGCASSCCRRCGGRGTAG